MTHSLNGEEIFPSDAWQYLSSLMSETRRQRMLEVVDQRTNHLRLVVQDIHNPHNVSACLRSAEAFGIQSVDVVTLREKFKPSTVARGVNHWLTIQRFFDVEACAKQLHAKGFKIAAGLPRSDALPLQAVPLDQPLAIVFGNEHDGVDPSWFPHLDFTFTVPMIGMVESLNISVSAAITMFKLMENIKARGNMLLSDDAKAELLNTWSCRQYRNWPQLLERLRNGQDIDPQFKTSSV